RRSDSSSYQLNFLLKIQQALLGAGITHEENAFASAKVGFESTEQFPSGTAQIPKGFVTGAFTPLSQSNRDLIILSHSNQKVKHKFCSPVK
ncbi:MAG: hypothetical protein PHP58_06375, partial [Eubacteriales bacterium]|nr:hypothetical protein [Eubacteriales bacterium]